MHPTMCCIFQELENSLCMSQEKINLSFRLKLTDGATHTRQLAGLIYCQRSESEESHFETPPKQLLEALFYYLQLSQLLLLPGY